MSKARDEFIIETFNLSNINQEQWMRFMQAMDEYTREIVESSVQASHYEIAFAAGRARQALMFLKDLKDIREIYQKIRRG